MRSLSASECNATHEIFNHGNILAGNYYGHRTWDETKGYASRNRWIMFPVANVDSLREGASFPAPNMYLSFEGDIVSDGRGRAECWVGVTYGNGSAMDWLRVILRRSRLSSVFIAAVNGLGSDWVFEVFQKIHVNYHQSTPIYHGVDNLEVPSLTIQDIKESIEGSDEGLYRPGDEFDGEEVKSCITTVGICKWADPTSFDDDFRTAFGLLSTFLSLR